MKRRFILVVVTILLSMGLVVTLESLAPAQASAQVYGPLPSRKVCVEDRTNGSSVYRVPQAEYSWDTPTDLIIYRYNAGGCSGWKNHIRISVVTDARYAESSVCSGDGVACARPVAGKWGRVDISLKKSAMLRLSLASRQHVVAHELGHAFGMWWHTSTAWSVMRIQYPPNAPVAPTWRDINYINAVY